MQKWLLRNVKADYKKISNTLGVSELICRIMLNRNISGFELMDSFINPSMDKFHNPRLMKDIELGVSIMKKAIENNLKIRICGDYDQDGNSSVLTLYNGLKRCGANVDYVIPHRVIDGYGINERIVENANKDGIDVIITCDNGISAIDSVKLAKDLGMKVIITDHHDVPNTLPEADAVINPKRVDCNYPFKELCGAGVALKFIQVLYEEMNVPIEESYNLLEFVAMATVCDVVDLVDENRIIVKEGLKRINETKNIGIRALIKATGLEGKTITTYSLGFVIGPCINASGRLDSADIAVELFLTDSQEKAEEYANKLHKLNEERKSMTIEGVDKVIQKIEESNIIKDKIIVAYEPSIHESIAGIIAGRIKDKYNKPTIIITDSTEEGISKASARSIEEYNMIEAIAKCKELLNKFGGHPMAAGFSLNSSNIDKLRYELNGTTTLTEDDLLPKLYIDAHVPINVASIKLAEELNMLEPFGKGNHKPIFADKGIIVKKIDILGRDYKIIKMSLQNKKGRIVTGVYFGDIELMQKYIINKYGEEELNRAFNGQANNVELDITYLPSINEYNGNRYLQVVIQDYR
ncbi:single-stranded-DNA-specific exonuclease RecJ [Gottschalkia acidurici 9a]|uniref:Single-stranded-DNA-specific exonuclease RecJ n=1 Tax=Gottschalkia acidurici (strain ATCC 7906 / DSM 604 / BCRC 14475 / CIP 104303 / KCTC 5404 / NCIMB 10678 / 9a) TaxID=1128398 RepID=K0B273_GOTA9|nr:single-stranded-DNA-specific exonuclease RecJ [Gottschalkia acidurici]AFS78746.1 single-stranded-DNA-specific exonuclease RecJ [Gottschalkia acidurici 9a]